jgi:23S rRNA (adenine2503-C2)-methyltransferase
MERATEKINLLNLSRAELADWLQVRHIRPYRANQIFKWLYIRQADDFVAMSDLKKEARSLLGNHFTLSRLGLETCQTAADGAVKYLFRLEDGQHIESVLIPERDHYTLCISSQVGCAQGCRFCLTARSGLVRNLTQAEIVSQVRDILRLAPKAMPLTNLVLMGMGEPLANYNNVVRALAIITDSDCGLKLASRRVTLSTAGLVSKLPALGRDSKVNLAVSLNATDNPTRNRLMPINRKYPIEDLLAACRRFPLPTGRKITFEYILIKGVNDRLEDARRLARLLAPLPAKINLIPFNAHAGCRLRRPGDASILAFQKILLDKNYTVIIRHSKGQDISAACGQLRAKLLESGTKEGIVLRRPVVSAEP